MIYHITYISNGLSVKGYLGIPNNFNLPIKKLEEIPQLQFPITVFTQSIIQEQEQLSWAEFPAILYCRGGMGSFGRVKTHWIETFCSMGYVVLAPSYRGNEGGEGRDEFGGADTEDVLSAYHLLQNLPFVNPEHISMMGFSRGAINAVQASVQLPLLHKLILWSGVSDLSQTYEERKDLRRMLKRVLHGTPARNPQAYQQRSPIRLAEDIPCPVLIIHGTKDQQVDYSHGLHMYQKLKELGKKVDLHTYEEQGHLFPYSIHELASKRLIQWIEKG
ncbi:alpha/beta hydrolase family protein [Ammoniphilus resinae]|uniref:Dipeptidyl aminopeptidase/acylaminoacyl peptidase n=1 Tax=Ammoniphilus resinae TaxID=861532 RepID=A0ABS4GM91_9BACL|nr:prolyl oligopeptidase family serine peptidase [Ammoniphilus resinae]MBP1931371.1 dipeptidyl aminopeptidase/acylaminoacyl peptidase [Ammoniphilus resinae]